jgi:hypothetical protein
LEFGCYIKEGEDISKRSENQDWDRFAKLAETQKQHYALWLYALVMLVWFFYL